MMFNASGDLGAAMFKTWSEEQQREEIGKLVKGLRNGLPLGAVCKMAETIAGSREKAREHLHHFLSPKERKKAIAKESGGMKQIAEEYLL